MRHVILTCKNHPELRWSTKEIAVSNGRYNGQRTIFFNGQVIRDEKGNPRMYGDMSGVHADEIRPILDAQGSVVNYTAVAECNCKPECLEIAPEDSLVKREA